MRIAYLITAYKYPQQLLRLIDALDRESTSFLIHVDRKTDDRIFRPLVEALAARRNVRFLRRYTCHWGGFGIVRALLEGIREAVETELPFDYLVLMTGQDYPIKSNEHIDRFLHEHEGVSFVDYNSFPFAAWKNEHGGWDRVRLWHFSRNGRHFTFPGKAAFRSRLLNRLWRAAGRALPLRRRFPAGFHPYGGSQLCCLHRNHARRIYEFVRNNRRFVRFFRFVSIPDEIILQTIVANRFDPRELHNDGVHYIDWREDGPHPSLFGASDFDALRSTHYLFARKFDATVDSEILDRIDRELLSVEPR